MYLYLDEEFNKDFQRHMQYISEVKNITQQIQKSSDFRQHLTNIRTQGGMDAYAGKFDPKKII